MLAGDDSRDLIASLERLKGTRTARRPASQPLSEIEIEIEIGRSVSTVVKLAQRPDGALTAVKTAISQRGAALIQREGRIHRELNHSLAIGFREFHPAGRSKAPGIVTEFAGNGSLAHHLPITKNPEQFGLRGPNRIARIVVGIVIAMRYLHSRGVVHRDLKPDNVLLDWDWNVRIADFGDSTLHGSLEPPSLIDPEKSLNLLSVDWHYSAPECYGNEAGPGCDVFSFGLILRELAVGRPTFLKEWQPLAVAKRVLVDSVSPHGWCQR
jgi:serine/threonine protein kinase